MGCPFISEKTVWVGFNDLETTNNELAKEWHPKKNGYLRPSDVVARSNKRIGWLCNNNHEWIASLADRNSRKSVSILNHSTLLII